MAVGEVGELFGVSVEEALFVALRCCRADLRYVGLCHYPRRKGFRCSAAAVYCIICIGVAFWGEVQTHTETGLLSEMWLLSWLLP